MSKAKFRTVRPNTSLIAPDGEKLTFTGRYLVLDNPKHIDYVRSELPAFVGVIEEVDMDETDIVDSVAEIKRQAIKEFLAQQAVQDSQQHVSEAPAASLKPTNTDNVAGVAASVKIAVKK